MAFSPTVWYDSYSRIYTNNSLEIDRGDDLLSTDIPSQASSFITRMIDLTDIDPKFTSQSGLCAGSPSSEETGSVEIRRIFNKCSASEAMRYNSGPAECAHFHYEFSDMVSIKIDLLNLEEETHFAGGNRENHNLLSNSLKDSEKMYCVRVSSLGKSWTFKRSWNDFVSLDEQCHTCLYDRGYSKLPEILPIQQYVSSAGPEVRSSLLQIYLKMFSSFTGPSITCGSVLNWFELDNRGHRLIQVTEDCDINTPAVAAAYAVRRYVKQSSDEVGFEVGDMISVIDMPSSDESVWWRGKKGFEVGFFPCEYVEVIGDKTEPQGLNFANTGHPSYNRSNLETSRTDDSGGLKRPSKPVLRKHGKLISFLRSFILSRPSRGKLKKSGILRERVFGCDLSEHLMNTGQQFPKVLMHCAEFIEENGIIDGIYRLSGIASNIQKLRVAFDEDRVPVLQNDRFVLQDIHSVASLLKMYFRELPNPICTYHLYEQFVAAAQAAESERIILLRKVIKQLPPPNYRTLEYLARHLYRVSLKGNMTGMTAKNVAIVWAPNLLRSKSIECGGVAALQGVGVQAVVTEYLIKYSEIIFCEKMPSYLPQTSTNSGCELAKAVSARKNRPKSMAVSSPTQLQLQSNLEQDEKYVEVGGGPRELPPMYHTVINIPSRNSSDKNIKSSGIRSTIRKSPLADWRAVIFGNKTTNKSERKSRKKINLNLSDGDQDVLLDDSKLIGLSPSSRSSLRPARSTEWLCSSARRSSSFERNRHIGVDIGSINMMIDTSESLKSPVCGSRLHSRSSSHNSFFESPLEITDKAVFSVKDGEKVLFSTMMSTDELDDLGEIKMSFHDEENEMKIFSEDEAMLSIGGDDSSGGFSPSPCQSKLVKTSSRSSPSNFVNKSIGSFREKLRRFTSSPSPGRRRRTTNAVLLSSESLEVKQVVSAAADVAVSSNKENVSSNKENVLVKRSKMETTLQCLDLLGKENSVDFNGKSCLSDNNMFSSMPSNISPDEDGECQLIMAQIHNNSVLEMTSSKDLNANSDRRNDGDDVVNYDESVISASYILGTQHDDTMYVAQVSCQERRTLDAIEAPIQFSAPPMPKPRSSIMPKPAPRTIITSPPVPMPRKIISRQIETTPMSKFNSADSVKPPCPIPRNILLRRNSFHNVPYIDISDPATRNRIEIYKEERRSKLRAKYKMEDYRTEKSSFLSCDKKEEAIDLMFSEPTMVPGENTSNSVPSSFVYGKNVEEDVNVKERAMRFRLGSLPVQPACCHSSTTKSASRIKNLAALFETPI